MPVPEFWALGAVATPPVSERRAAAPGVSCSPTKPEAPEFCVLMPLSASFCKPLRILLSVHRRRQAGNRRNCHECETSHDVPPLLCWLITKEGLAFPKHS
jgi:hypothetical protein